MFGILLAFVSSFFEEVSTSMGKAAVRRRAETIYAMGFLDNIWGLSFFFVLLIVFLRKGTPITFAAPLAFAVRGALSLLQSYVTVKAIALCDRSTYGFLRTLTIPLLLLSDLLLGYRISAAQIAGMAAIIAGLLFLFMNHGLSKKGIWYLAVSTVNGAATIALYKYDISHGNTLALEQFLILLLQSAFFYVIVRLYTKEKPLALLKKPLLAMQSASIGFSDVFGSFAMVFAPASIITAAERSSNVLWSVLSGRAYFHEKNLLIKVVSVLAFVIGIILLTAFGR